MQLIDFALGAFESEAHDRGGGSWIPFLSSRGGARWRCAGTVLI